MSAEDVTEGNGTVARDVKLMDINGIAENPREDIEGKKEN